MELALARSAITYTKEYIVNYTIPKYDNIMIGLISKRISFI
jgi:hypothetical protein